MNKTFLCSLSLIITILISSTALSQPRSQRGRQRECPGITVANRSMLRVAVFGDSLARTVGEELSAMGHRSGRFLVCYDSQGSTGLSQPELVNWPERAAREITQWRSDVVVYVFGTNDAIGMTHSVNINGHHNVYQFATPAWRNEYGQRVTRMLDIASDELTRHVIWVGVPIMRNPAFSARVSLINEVARGDIADRPDVLFINAWRRFQDAAGSFSYFLPDGHGRPQRVRETDGIHYTQAGGSLLAVDIEAAIRQYYFSLSLPRE